MLKFFLVGIFCVTQPYQDCTRVAGSDFFDTRESCVLAKKSFTDIMLEQNPSNTVVVECVSAYPINLTQKI